MAQKATGAVPTYETKRNKRRRSRGDRINEVATALGYPLLPWQYRVVDTATEYRVRDRMPYRKTALVTVPRQSGKSILVTAVAGQWLIDNEDQYAVITAQTRIAATNRLKHLAKVLTKSGLDPELHFTRGVGNERIILSNGSQIDVVSPTATSVHGESVDLAIVDEAWAVDPVFMAGVVPAMVARPLSQLWVISTAGTEDSQLLNEMVAKGRENPQGDTMAYTEYSMPDDAHPYDEHRWHEWMPALGHTTSIASINQAKDSLSLPEFRRAFGNIAITEGEAAAIPYEWWTAHYADLVPDVGLTIAVDVNRSPAGWSIATAWPEGDGYHADLVRHGVGLELRGIPDVVRDLVERFRPRALGLDPVGPAGALLPDFQAIADQYGVPLRTFSGRDRAKADVYLFDLLRDGKHSHGRSIPLDTAVEGAHAGEAAGNWFYSRPNSYVDISPLLAVSMATWLAYETETLAPVYAIY